MRRTATPVKEGKCPKDNRIRPVFVIMNNKRTLVTADGKGHAYKTYGEGVNVYSCIPKPENLIDPDLYEFERGLSGFDF
jgi:hypothetical protein